MTLPAPQSLPGRQVGVLKSQSQTNPEDQKVYGRKNSLAQLVEMRTFVLLYNDASGLQQPPLTVHEFGGTFYAAPNSSEWGKSLRPLEPWLQELATKRLNQREAGAAPPDTVDVMGGKEGE